MEENCCGGECASLKSSFMADVKPEDRCRIKEYAATLSLRKGQTIFENGRKAEGLFCIKRGTVKIELESSTGEAMTIDLLDNQGMLGHHCLISSRNYYTATCLSEAEICFIPKTVVNTLHENNPGLLSRINRSIADDQSRLATAIMSLRTKSVQQRTAEALIRLQNIFGKDAQGMIKCELTKEELAKLIGSSVESVFRSLSTFRKKDYIDFDKRKLWIKNEIRLRSVGKIHT